MTDPDDHQSDDWRWLLAGCVVAVGLALWLTSGTWGAAPQAGDDVMGHLIRNEYGILHLVNHGRLDGWFPRFMVGHQAYLFYGPGFSWLLGLVRLSTFGLLSTTGAMKVLTVASFVALGPAVAFLARSLGLSRQAAGVAAVLALAVDSPFGVGLHGTFQIGLVPNQVAAPFFCLALGAALRVPVDRRPRWIALAAVGAAIVGILHPITALALGLFLVLGLACLPLSDRVNLPALRRLLVTGALAAGLIAFWLVPYLVHRDLRGPVATWTTPQLGARVADILHGHLLFPRRLGWLVVAGFVFALVQAGRRRRYAAAAVAIPVGFLVVGHGIHHLAPTNDVSLLLANRDLGYAGLVAVIPLAALVGWLGQRGGRMGSAGGLVVAVALVVALPGSPRPSHERMPSPKPVLDLAAVHLRALVPDSGRFAMERDFPGEIERLGVTIPDLWLAHQSGRNDLNVFNGESSSAAGAGYVPFSIGTDPPTEMADKLDRLGVTHVVTVRTTTATTYAASDRFRLAWRKGTLAIFGVVPPAGQPSPATLLTTDGGPTRARLVSRSVEHPVLDVTTSDSTVATVALAWSPKWHASLDGRGVRLDPTPDQLLRLRLPAGTHRLRLDFRPDAWDRVGMLLSLVTLLLVGAWAARRYRMSSSFSRTA